MYNDWCTIESDPGVFTELIHQLGVPGAQVEEVYSMDDDYIITNLKPKIFGFIFLFKWTKNIQTREPLALYDSDLFFARQIVNNACATQAILSVLLNSSAEITGPLKQFHQFAKQLPCEDRGLVLSNSDSIRKIHNSFSRPQGFIFKEDKKSKKKGDVYHFISYVPHKGQLYELDGLQTGPILIGKIDQSQQNSDPIQAQDKWINLAKQQIQNRILKYSEKQIRFNLLVVCENLQAKKQNQNNSLAQQKASILKKLKSLGHEIDQQYIKQFPDCSESGLSSVEELNHRLSEIAVKINDNMMFIEEEKHKAQKRKVCLWIFQEENVRRKHNYLPLILQMLKTMAKKDMLADLIKQAKDKKKVQSK